MKTVNILPIPIYEFTYDLELTDKIVEKIKTLNYMHNGDVENNQITVEMFYDENLFKWFEECLSKVVERYYLPDLKLVITNAWVNKNVFNTKHHYHTHPNSIVSGIFYLTDSSSSTMFYNRHNPWTRIHDEGFLSICDSEENNLQRSIKDNVNSEKGKLILFPSSIPHTVPINKERFTRYTISFNSFINGTINKVNGKGPFTLTANSIKNELY